MRHYLAVWLLLITQSGLSLAIAQQINWRKISDIKNARAIAINGSDHIFIASQDTVLRSTDSGEHWTALNTAQDEPRGFTQMTIDPHGILYGASWAGIRRSTDNGDTWTLIRPLMGGYSVICDSSGHVFVAAGSEGLVRSIDRGNTWQKVLDHGNLSFIVIGPSQELIASARTFREPWAARSTDDGESWQEYGYGLTSLAFTSNGSMFAGTGYDGMYGNVGKGPYLFRSTDKGATWEKVYEGSIYAVAVNADDQIFAGLAADGIITSTDDGMHWSQFNVGLTANTVFSLARNSSGTIFAGTEEGLFQCVQTVPVPLLNHDLYVSQDGTSGNSGVSPSAPLRSIADALSRIYADSLHPHTIHIADGTYGVQETGEAGSIYLRSYISLAGESETGVIIHGTNFSADNDTAAGLQNFTLKNGAISLDRCSPTLHHLTIAGTGPNGEAGIRLYESCAAIQDVDVSGANSEAGILMYGSSPTLTRVTIHHNNGWLCGGIRIEDDSSPVLINVTISENSGWEMGGLECNGGHPVLINTIIWNNSSPGVEQRAFPNSGCSITFTHCNVEGGKEKIHIVNYGGGVPTTNWLEGNLDVNPLFVDPKNGDFRLQQGSPCIDTGTRLFVWQGDTLVNRAPDQYRGLAPDIGAREFETLTGMPTAEGVGTSYALNQNYPNPFNPATTIWFTVGGVAALSGAFSSGVEGHAADNVRLVVYDLLGREVAVLVNEKKAPGIYSVIWNARGTPSGMYFYRLTAGDFSETKRLMMLK
jgi:photosystem II stability/assembly factor-like uncharacterized protein